MTGQPWRVRYDGPCARCGTILRAGEVAVWDRRARVMQCVECPTGTNSLDAGVAGASARRRYQDLHERREAETRARLGSRLGGLVLRFTDDPQSIRAWGIGATGEEELGAAFAAVEGLRILNDRAVKGSRANIDHILVAPAGVFVVDAKNYTGVVEVKNVGSIFRTELRLYVGGRDRSKLADGLARQLTAVRAALGGALLPMPPITPVLCFIGARWPRFRPPTEFEGVRLESPDSLKRLMAEPAVLDGGAIDGLARVIAKALPAR